MIPEFARQDFARPELLSLLFLLPAWLFLVWPRAGRAMLFAPARLAGERGAWFHLRAGSVLIVPRLLRALTLAAIVIALADPQRVEMDEETVVTGIGMALAVDLSTSMLAEDMGGERSRIDVAREAAVRFAASRPLDELSLVGFAGEALTRVPPTTDPDLVVAAVETLRLQLVRDGTDISAAVLTATARLLESEREPRVLVLLTDGAHNGTRVPPLAAARAAAALGVRVHAISVVGPVDTARAPAAARTTLARRQGDVLIEMRTVLQGIADITGGRYFHAGSAQALDSIYAEIDRLEPPVETVTGSERRESERRWPLLFAFGLLGLESVLRSSRWSAVS